MNTLLANLAEVACLAKEEERAVGTTWTAPHPLDLTNVIEEGVDNFFLLIRYAAARVLDENMHAHEAAIPPGQVRFDPDLSHFRVTNRVVQ